MSLNDTWNAVKKFHETFNHPVAVSPTFISSDRVKKRYSWMIEELNEFTNASDIVEQADAMIDLIYFAIGTLVEMGVEPEPVFQLVQKANMSKLWEDGKPHYDKNNKVIKPSSWVPPEGEIAREIQRQIDLSQNK